MLTDRELTVLEEVIAGPGWTPGKSGPAWTPRAILQAVVGRELIERGWLVHWPALDAITLTPLAAYRMNVRVEHFEEDEEPVFVPITAPEPVVVVQSERRQVHSPLLHLTPARPTRDPDSDRSPKNGPPKLAGGLGIILKDVAKRRKPGRTMVCG